MIFINLLPDIKVEHLKMLRLRRVLVSVAIIVFAVCAALCTLVYVIAATRLDTMKKYQTSNDEKVNAALVQEDVAKILNLKYKVDIVKALHDYKTDPERLFVGPKYLEKILPEESSIYDKVDFNFVNNEFTITGFTEDYDTTRDLEKTIQYAGYENCTQDNYYSRLYLFKIDSSEPVGYKESSDETGLGSYTATGQFATALFDSQRAQKDLALVIPNIIASDDHIIQPEAVCYDNLDNLVPQGAEGWRPLAPTTGSPDGETEGKTEEED